MPPKSAIHEKGATFICRRVPRWRHWEALREVADS